MTTLRTSTRIYKKRTNVATCTGMIVILMISLHVLQSLLRRHGARKYVALGTFAFKGHLTDAIAHTRYRDNILPLALTMFDWTVYNENANIIKRRPTPVYVFCQASKSSIHRLADELPSDFRGSVLLVGGEDMHLSEAMEQSAFINLVAKFNITRYEAKDIDHKDVDTFPMGLLPHYTMQHSDIEIRHSISSASLENKPNLLLAAWGKVWPHLDAMKSRKEANDFINSVAWVERQSIDLDMWWSSLKLYKFMLCPTGNGIQSPKFVEAFLTLTVPVVQNESAYFDLKRQGFPILIVDSWNKITPDFLERQWKVLSPKLEWAQSMFITKNWYHYVTRTSS